ncbi:putative lipid II flippase FtsW [bacterium]|nr:putative lipid II flippase FtsW [bacterium]
MDDFFKEPVGKLDHILLTIIAALAGCGVIMVFSASSAIALEKFGSSNVFLYKHFGRVVIGFVGMMIVAKIDYHKLQKIIIHLLVISIVLLILLPFFGVKIKGATRWFSILGFTFMPSELAKFTLVIYFANFLAQRGIEIRDLKKGLVPALCVVFLFFVLILAHKNYSTGAVVSAIGIIMIFVGGANLKHLLSLVLVAVPALVIGVIIEPYRMRRIMDFLSTDFEKMSYQMKQAYIGLGSGGIGGVGFGASKQKLMFLPEQYTDFIFAVIGEELGFIGELIIIILFLALLYRGMKIAKFAPDNFGKFLAVGITVSIVIYAFLNIAVVSGVLPTTGLPLPFISYGGTSVILTFWAVGILLSISRAINREEPEKTT